MPSQENITKAFNQIHRFLEDLTSIHAIEPFNKNNADTSILYSEIHKQKEVFAAYCKMLSFLLWPTKQYTKIPDKSSETILSIYSQHYYHQNKKNPAENIQPSHKIRAEYNVYDTLIIKQSPFGKRQPTYCEPEYNFFNNYTFMLQLLNGTEPIILIEKKSIKHCRITQKKSPNRSC